MSCNNIDMGKSSGKDTEPSISLYGILNTIQFSNKLENLEAFTSPHVYVSNLLRTWITAVLLYGNNRATNFFYQPIGVLKLYVYPWLKENKVMKLERGNYPKNFFHTLKKFRYFFIELKRICTDEIYFNRLANLYHYKIMNDPDTYTQRNLNYFHAVFKNGNAKPPPLESFNTFSEWYIKLVPRIELIIPNQRGNGMQTVTFNRDGHGYYSYNVPRGTFDTVGPNSTNQGFTSDANIYTFMSQCYSDEYNYHENRRPFSYQYEGVDIVHVVSHSNAMQGFLEGKGINIKENQEYTLQRLKESNSWRFRIKYTPPGTADLVEDSIKVGVPGDDYIRNRAALVEAQIREGSLCGNPGSVARRGTSRGGGKRRRTIKRTKTRKNRKNKKSRKY
jgi:hypothetical protein